MLPLRRHGWARGGDGIGAPHLRALVLAVENTQPAFSRAVVDLLPYCGQEVTVDGLMIADSDFPIDNIYLVQRIRAGTGDWTRANRFTEVWAQRNPGAGGKGPWFRRDPRILSLIDRDGYLGLGPEANAAFIAGTAE